VWKGRRKGGNAPNPTLPVPATTATAESTSGSRSRGDARRCPSDRRSSSLSEKARKGRRTVRNPQSPIPLLKPKRPSHERLKRLNIRLVQYSRNPDPDSRKEAQRHFLDSSVRKSDSCSSEDRFDGFLRADAFPVGRGRVSRIIRG
jgi:hypothetical protein